jgi:hypothetical protein
LFIVSISVTFDVSDADRDFLETDGDLRAKLDLGSKKRKMESTSELAETKEALQRMTDEMNQLRKDMDEMRKEHESKRAVNSEEFALGYCAKDFLAMNPTKSLQWVSATLVPRLKQEVTKHQSKMLGLDLIKGSRSQSILTCAGYNRGGNCLAKWHIHERCSKNNPQQKFKDLRLHCCTLCCDGLGILVEHPFTSCPWIKAGTWKKLEEPNSPTEV